MSSHKCCVSDVPKLVASKITMANLGDTVTLECMVDAHPEPKMMFWRDAQGRTPVIQSGKHDVNVIRSKEDYTKFVMELTISKLTETDDGDYFCHAENSFGSSTKPVSVRIRNSVSTRYTVDQSVGLCASIVIYYIHSTLVLVNTLKCKYAFTIYEAITK